MKQFSLNTLLSLATLLFLLIVLEFALGFFPVTQVTRTQSLSDTAQAFDVSTYKNTSISGSQGFDFKHARTRLSNNFGFFSDTDFTAGASVNLAIGDSFTEAMQVDFEQTFHQRAAVALDEPFYPLAISGNPLSQYEAYTQQACETFNINKAVYLIIRNDFDESLYEHRRRSGFFHYRRSETGVELKPTPYKLSFARRMLTRSNLVRYLYFNLKMGALLRSQGQEVNSPEDLLKARREQLDANIEAIDIFLDRIDDYCLDKQNMIFMVKADNQSFQGGETLPNLAESRDYFINSARKSGYQIVDLQAPFKAHFEKNAERFDHEHDAHWNALGHELAAQTLVDYIRP